MARNKSLNIIMSCLYKWNMCLPVSTARYSPCFIFSVMKNIGTNGYVLERKVKHRKEGEEKA